MAFPVAVNLSAPSSQPVTVSYATADGTDAAGTDYLPAAGTLTFAPGETRKTILITLRKDHTQEATVEAFFVNLSGAVHATLLDGQGLGTILNDD